MGVRGQSSLLVVHLGCAPDLFTILQLIINNEPQDVGILLVRVPSCLRGDSGCKSCSIYYPEENLFVLIVRMCKAFK